MEYLQIEKKGQCHNYCIYLASMHFSSIDDFINLELAVKRFHGNMTKFFYNPIPLTLVTRKFFPCLRTLYQYTDYDELFEDDENIIERVKVTNHPRFKFNSIEKLIIEKELRMKMDHVIKRITHDNSNIYTYKQYLKDKENENYWYKSIPGNYSYNDENCEPFVRVLNGSNVLIVCEDRFGSFCWSFFEDFNHKNGFVPDNYSFDEFDTIRYSTYCWIINSSAWNNDISFSSWSTGELEVCIGDKHHFYTLKQRTREKYHGEFDISEMIVIQMKEENNERKRDENDMFIENILALNLNRNEFRLMKNEK